MPPSVLILPSATEADDGAVKGYDFDAPCMPCSQASTRLPSRSSTLSSGNLCSPKLAGKLRANQPSIRASLCADLLAAIGIGFTLAIILGPLDLALLRSAKSASPHLSSIIWQVLQESINQPQFILPALRWTWLLFCLTYAAANVSRTVCSLLKCNPTAIVWLTTTVVNCTVGCMKDAVLGGGTLVPPLPAILAWVGRDLLFSLVVFVLPVRLGRVLEAKGITHWKGSRVEDLMQVALPLPLQFFTTPLQFLGLSFVNHPAALPWAERCAAAFHEFLPKVGIRCARVLIPYSFGAVGNRRLRAKLELCLPQAATRLQASASEAAAKALAANPMMECLAAFAGVAAATIFLAGGVSARVLAAVFCGCMALLRWRPSHANRKRLPVLPQSNRG